MADETEVRAIKTGQQNQVRIALSVRDGSKRLLNLTVNKPYRPMPRRSILVSDGEPDLKHQDPQLHQLCILHAIKRLTYTLWRERASKEEREHLKSELERILYTLINSTRTHASDGDHQALRRRIESTLNQLSNLAVTLKRQGYREASQFIIRNSKLLVTFAELALKGIRIPYTTNQIERLMGEIAKRCKHQWAHWSCEGLKNTLTFILIHYTNPTLYEEYWKTYIHQCPIKTTILTTQI
jgi:transposase-like protein